MSPVNDVRVRELPVGETGLAHQAMAALRPHHSDLDAFVRRVDEVQRAEGYRVLAAFSPDAVAAVGVLGFRRASNLAWGDTLYVDDLSVLPSARRGGVARALLDAVVVIGRADGLDMVHLDSGHQRHDAHKLYLAYGFDLTSHHFNLTL